VSKLEMVSCDSCGAMSPAGRHKGRDWYLICHDSFGPLFETDRHACSPGCLLAFTTAEYDRRETVAAPPLPRKERAKPKRKASPRRPSAERVDDLVAGAGEVARQIDAAAQDALAGGDGCDAAG